MEQSMLQVGQVAPKWTSNHLSSDQLQGQAYILYFYPKDDTPGCTLEACDFRDQQATFLQKGYRIIGVSPDSQDSHEKFKQKYDLPFDLISDENHKIAEDFGVWREKKNYGKVYVGLVRATFLIDEKGMIKEIYDNVKATGHVARLVQKI
jgi:peroxiredoxin Q/BCP